ARRWRPGAGRSASCARRCPTWSRSSFAWCATEPGRRHDGPRPRRQGAPALLYLLPLLHARERVPRALGVLLLHQPELLRAGGRVPGPLDAGGRLRRLRPLRLGPHREPAARGGRDLWRAALLLGGHLERGGDDLGDAAPPAAPLALRPLLHLRARRGGHRQRELP